MSRRSGSIKRRTIVPEAKYGDVVAASLINYMMQSGAKSVAEKIFYDALTRIEEKTGKKGIELFHEALNNIKPQLEVRSRRVGGVTYQVPVEVRPERMQTLAIRWIIQSARSRKGRSMSEKLASELMDAANNAGAAIKKRDETRKMAEANRAFSHYKW